MILGNMLWFTLKAHYRCSARLEAVSLGKFLTVTVGFEPSAVLYW